MILPRQNGLLKSSTTVVICPPDCHPPGILSSLAYDPSTSLCPRRDFAWSRRSGCDRVQRSSTTATTSNLEGNRELVKSAMAPIDRRKITVHVAVDLCGDMPGATRMAWPRLLALRWKHVD